MIMRRQIEAMKCAVLVFLLTVGLTISHQSYVIAEGTNNGICSIDEDVGRTANFSLKRQFIAGSQREGEFACYSYNVYGEPVNMTVEPGQEYFDCCEIWYKENGETKNLFLWRDPIYCIIDYPPIEYHDTMGNIYMIVNTGRRVNASYVECMIFGNTGNGNFAKIKDLQHYRITQDSNTGNLILTKYSREGVEFWQSFYSGQTDYDCYIENGKLYYVGQGEVEPSTETEDQQVPEGNENIEQSQQPEQPQQSEQPQQPTAEQPVQPEENQEKNEDTSGFQLSINKDNEFVLTGKDRYFIKGRAVAANQTLIEENFKKLSWVSDDRSVVDVVGTTYTLAESANGPIVADFQVELENFTQGEVSITGFLDGQEKAKFIVDSKGKIEWYVTSNTLYIKGFGEISDYDTNDNKAPWWGSQYTVSYVEIEDGITSIGENALDNIGPYIIIPASVVSIKEKGIPKEVTKENSENKEKETQTEVLLVTLNSASEIYAKENGYDYYSLDPISITCKSAPKACEEENTALYQIQVEVSTDVNCNLSNVYCNPLVSTSEKNAEVIWNTSLEEPCCLTDKDTISWTFDIKVTNLDQYRDGGKIAYDVKVVVNKDTNEYSLKEQSFELYFDAANGESNELDLERDVWHFKNTGEAPTPLNDKDKEKLVSGVSATEYARLEKEIARKKGTTGGSCFGLSLLVILNKMNVFNMAYKLPEKTYQDNKSWITYYHFSQYFTKRMAALQEFGMKSDLEKIQEIVSETEQVERGGAPVLLELARYEPKEMGHAVVMYKVEDTDKEINGKKFNKKILTYDSNAYDDGKNEWAYETALYVNTETGDWKYYSEALDGSDNYLYIDNGNVHQAFESGIGRCDLQWCQNNIEVLNLKDYEKSYKFSPEIIVESEKTLTIQNGDRNFSVGDQGISADDIQRYCDVSSDLTADRQDIHIVLPDPNSPVSLSTHDGKTAALDITYNSNDVYYRVEADFAIGVECGMDQSVILKGNQGSYTISTAYNNYPEGILPIYTVTGDTTGDVCIHITDTGIIVNGENELGGTTIIAENQQKHVRKFKIEGGTDVVIDGKDTKDTASSKFMDSVKTQVQKLWDDLAEKWNQISLQNKKILLGIGLIAAGLSLLGLAIWLIQKIKRHH